MLEPIDIDINMNQNVSEEAAKAATANEEMTKSVDNMQKEIERLNKVIQDMSVALAEQKKLTADSGSEFDNAAKKIEAMQAALDKAAAELSVYQNASEQINKAVREGADVTDILSEAREALSETEGALVDNAKELINNQDEINTALEYGEKIVNVNSTSNKLLSASIKSICDLLGIENTQIKNSISNVKLITAGKQAWRNGVVLLNKELGVTIAQAKKILAISLATGIGIIAAAVTVAVVAYKAYNKEKKEASRLAEEEKKLNKEVATEYANQASKVRVLVNEINNENISNDLRKKRIEDLKKIIPDYNGMLDKEGKLINNNTNAIERYLIALKEEIRLKSQRERLEKLYAKQNEIEEELAEKNKFLSDNVNNPKAKPIVNYTPYGNITTETDLSKEMYASTQRKRELLKEQEQINKEINNVENRYNAQLASNTAVQKNITLDSLNNREEEIKQLKELYQKKEIGSKEYLSLENQIKEKEAALNKLKGKTNPEERKAEATEKKAKEAAQRAAKEQEKAAATLEKKAYDYQKRIDDARVKAIHEGAEKERQAAKAELDQTAAYIDKEYKSLADLEKKTGKPATQQKTMLAQLDIEATRQYESEIGRINAKSKTDIDNIFTEVNARFASELQQNITDINRYYADLIKEATKAGAAIDDINRLQEAKDKDIDRANIQDKLRQADLDEALEMEKANNLASVGLVAVAEEAKLEIVKKYLKERIELLCKEGSETSNKEADILAERLKGLQSSPKSISGMMNGVLFDKIKKGLEKTGVSAEEAEKKTVSLFASFQKGGAQAEAVINDLKGMFGGLDEGLDAALDAVGNIASGFAQGGIVGGAMAVIGEGIKMFTSAAQVEKEHQQALKQLALAKLEMQREYNLLLLKEQLIYKQGTNIFGTNQIRGAANAINTYRETIRQFNDELKGEKPKLDPFQAIFNNGLESYKKKLQAYNDGIGALANVDIVTGSKKTGGFLGIGKKRKDVYSNLLDVYDDIRDTEGKLNTARIQAILNTHKMSDENKALLESLLKLDEAAKEAEEQLKNYLTQTFGSLGDALTDSIVTAFANGTDAAQLFKGNVTDMLNDLAKQMVFGLYLKDTFDKLEKDIEQSYNDLADDKLTEEQLSKKITDILGGFFGGLDGDIEKANKFLEEFWKNAEANGFDRPEAERQGATGGLANASQDSINELTGGVYAVRQIVGDIRNDNREELLVQRTIMGQLALLVERSEYWLHLKELPRVVRKLEDIEAYGLKLKGV